jgi:hypothetical protein
MHASSVRRVPTPSCLRAGGGLGGGKWGEGDDIQKRKKGTLKCDVIRCMHTGEFMAHEPIHVFRTFTALLKGRPHAVVNESIEPSIHQWQQWCVPVA